MTIATLANEKKSLVTPKMLETAKAEAERLAKLAYLPHPVPQPDGTSIELCWSGRISRAYDKLAEAKLASDPKMIAAIEKAVKAIEDQGFAAWDAANRASQSYASMAASVGQEIAPDAFFPGQCQCQGCQKQCAQATYFAAEEGLARAFRSFMAAGADNLPPVVELMRKVRKEDAQARDMIWRHLLGIQEAAEAYIAACDNYGVAPAWRAILARR